MSVVLHIVKAIVVSVVLHIVKAIVVSVAVDVVKVTVVSIAVDIVEATVVTIMVDIVKVTVVMIMVDIVEATVEMTAMCRVESTLVSIVIMLCVFSVFILVNVVFPKPGNSVVDYRLFLNTTYYVGMGAVNGFSECSLPDLTCLFLHHVF